MLIKVVRVLTKWEMLQAANDDGYEDGDLQPTAVCLQNGLASSSSEYAQEWDPCSCGHYRSDLEESLRASQILSFRVPKHANFLDSDFLLSACLISRCIVFLSFRGSESTSI